MRKKEKLKQWRKGKIYPSGCRVSKSSKERKEKMQKQRRKGKLYPFECRVPKNSKERLKKKPSSVINAKK